MIRKDRRAPLEMRPLVITRGFLPYAEGSCLVEFGMTKVIVSASIQDGTPPWLTGSSSGWVTAEYGMLPRATQVRNKRPVTTANQNGRTMEIQRLIGRSLRAVVDLERLGERTVTVDCDVLNADGGTRTASITGAAVALFDACEKLMAQDVIKYSFIKEFIAAVSVGIREGELIVDLCYEEDSSADVDMNVIMTESGGLVEIQGTAEGNTFDRADLDRMIDAASSTIGDIINHQKRICGIQ